MSHKITRPYRLKGFVEAELASLNRWQDQVVESIEQEAFHIYEDVIVTSPSTPNTFFKIVLKNLDKTPTGYVVIKKDKAVDVYNDAPTSTTLWGLNFLWLKATVASAKVTIRVT